MKIFMAWDKGEDAAPETVRRVITLWRERNPGHDVVVFDRAAMDANLADANVALDHLNIQARADILRVKMLVEQGGVWADASLLPVQPLDTWLPELLEPAGFFAFRRCGYDRVIGNWFLAGKAGNPLMTAWYEAMQAYFAQPRRPAKEASLVWRLRRRFGGGYMSTINRGPGADYPYFATHYLFERMIAETPDLAEDWDHVPVWPVLPTHSLQHARFHSRMTDAEFRASVPALIAKTPVQKLDWRHDWPDEIYATT